MKILIAGLGRIGRRLVHICAENNISAFIFDTHNIKHIYHLLKYDSVYGICENIAIKNNSIFISNVEFPIYNKEKCNIAFDCTGKSIDLNAEKIIRSYPSENVYIFGTNSKIPNRKIISNGSCTTQALAPIIYELKNEIESIQFTTIHSYTADQRLVDGYHDDLYRSRAAAMSIIPTSTGASKIMHNIFPHINIMGKSIRVPTINVSCLDITMKLKKSHTKEYIISKLLKSNYIEISYEKLVSVDFVKRRESAIIDYNNVHIQNNILNLIAWYDNEYGYSYRLFDLLKLLRNDLQNSSSPHNI